MGVSEHWPREIIDDVAEQMPGRRLDANRNVLAQAIRALMDAGYVVRPATDRGAVGPSEAWFDNVQVRSRDGRELTFTTVNHGTGATFYVDLPADDALELPYDEAVDP